MSERAPLSYKNEKYDKLSFDVASSVTLHDGGELLFGHTVLGDFRLQAAPSPDNPQPRQLFAYHSVEPSMLAHVLRHIIHSNPSKTSEDIVKDVLALEAAMPVGELRYPARAIDESVDRQHSKAFPLNWLLPINDDDSTPTLYIGHEGRLTGHMYFHGEGILITDEEWDDNAEFEVDEEDFKIDDLPRIEIEVAHIDNEDLPAFAAALIATARTDYGRVKYQDMIDTLLSAL